MAIDPVTLVVVQNALQQIGNEMDAVLERTAFSPVISEARDRANGIHHGQTGAVVSQGESGLPIFIGVMHFAVQSAIAAFPELEPGDAILLNDPYLGGTHLMDTKLVKPFFHNGKIFAYLANTAHWSDIGGSRPGGFSPQATEIFQEGLRITPVRLFRRGELQEDLLNLILSNVRIPKERLGDLKAQIAALNVGERRLTEVLAKYGADTVQECIDELVRRSEQQMRACIETIPNGSYEFETFMDNDGITMDPLRVHLIATVSGGDITLDFSQSNPPVDGPFNCAFGATAAAVYMAIKHIFPEVPVNAGCFAPIKVVAPETTFLNGGYPKAVSGCAAEVTCRITDAVFGALGQAIPEKVPAACFGSVSNFTLGGTDPKRDNQFIMFTFSGGGYGGNSWCDGMTNGSAPISIARTSPVEVLEQYYPIVFEEFAIRERSAGAGRYRGGFGISQRIRLLRGKATSGVLTDRGIFAPFGAQGGKEAGKTEIFFGLKGKKWLPPFVTKADAISLIEGDTITLRTPGGGGYGDPLRRPAADVLRDVVRGLITAEDASSSYGVAIEAGSATELAVNEAETARMRAL